MDAMNGTCSMLDTVRLDERDSGVEKLFGTAATRPTPDAVGLHFGPQRPDTGVEKVAPGRAAFLGASSRRGASFLDTSIEHVFAGASRGRRWGSDGAWLRRPAGFSYGPVWSGGSNAVATVTSTASSSGSINVGSLTGSSAGVGNVAANGPAPSVADQMRNGTVVNWDTLAPSQSPSPVSVEMTQKGATPFIGSTTKKPNQAGTDVVTNDNPWLSRGGPNMKVGDPFYSTVSLEYVLAFDNTPNAGQWGRNVWNRNTWTNGFTVEKDGSVSLRARATNDTDLENDYISGNKVYMYDQPGRGINIPLIAPATQSVFEVWAKSGSGKTLSNWYYVDPAAGKFYGINPPTPYTPPPPQEPRSPWHRGYGQGGYE